MKKMKRCLAALLVLLMVVSLAPEGVFAQSGKNGGREAAAEEVEAASRIDGSAGQSDRKEPARYADDELITAIVVLSEAPVMSYFGKSAYAALDEDTTSGEAVSGFLASEDAQTVSEELLEGQEDVVEAIEKLPDSDGAAAMPDDVEIVAQWTGLVNALAVKIPYGRLAEVKELPGVADAYVEVTYDRPEEPETNGARSRATATIWWGSARSGRRAIRARAWSLPFSTPDWISNGAPIGTVTQMPT
ncbi:MAG: hypothetical protein Q4C48_06725 [Lachnospiraceae bacterium]|nr:hypothetical protein [Lachnospiraceae bacterium]